MLTDKLFRFKLITGCECPGAGDTEDVGLLADVRREWRVGCGQLDDADGGSIDKDHGSLQYINRSVRDLSSLQYVGHVDPDLLPFRSTCLVPPQYGGAGLSTGNVVTLLVFAGLGYLLAKKYGDDILKRVA